MCFRKVLCLCLGVVWAATVTAQQYAYQVSFTDKSGSPSITNPSAFLSARAISRRVAQGLIIDSTDVPVSPIYLDSTLALTHGILHVTSKWLNMCVILVPDTSMIITLRTKSYVTGVKMVAHYSTFLHHKTTTTQTPFVPAQWQQLAKTSDGATYYGQTFPQTELVNGQYLHNNGYQGQGKLIAVIDAGFQDADIHPGLDSLRAAGGYVDVHNFTLDTSYVFSYDSHGLSTLSAMAGYNPGISGSNAYVGSAPLARYALYITEDDASEQLIELNNLVGAAERADSIGADIITVSLGYDTFDDPSNNFNFQRDFDGKSTITARAANLATKKGILFVASAGNEGAGVPGWGNYILTPGEADSALTVGAVDINKNSPAFSGYGPNAAGQVKPDVCLLGVSAAIYHTGNLVVKEDGTSFSTPQLAGWAACLWQAAGAGTTPYMLRKAINQSADHYTNPGPQIGYGVPDFQKAFQLLDVKDTPNLPATSPVWVIAEGNPFTSTINVVVKVPAKGNVDFVLTDISGRKIVTNTQMFYPGWNPRTTIPAPGNLPAGIYILHAISATQQAVLKMVKE
jgi:serine protease AprX